MLAFSKLIHTERNILLSFTHLHVVPKWESLSPKRSYYEVLKSQNNMGPYQLQLFPCQ